MRVAFYGRGEQRKTLEERGNGKRDWTEEVSACPGCMQTREADALDAVIVESIDRLSRMTADGTRIERELEARDLSGILDEVDNEELIELLEAFDAEIS